MLKFSRLIKGRARIGQGRLSQAKCTNLHLKPLYEEQLQICYGKIMLELHEYYFMRDLQESSRSYPGDTQVSYHAVFQWKLHAFYGAMIEASNFCLHGCYWHLILCGFSI